MSTRAQVKNAATASYRGLFRPCPPFRITPPPPSFPAYTQSVNQHRSFFSRRLTSFYTHSFPPKSDISQVPFTPPSPSDTNSSTATDGASGDDPKRAKKERYLDSLMDKAGELSLRCSVLDSEGNWTAEEGRYKKTQLCRDYDLDPRDLRKLDSLTPNLVPVILTRRTCMLISMMHIRALIKPDRVVVFDTAGTKESEVSRRFKWHLERNIKAGLSVKGEEDEDGEAVLSYEHRALESILVATTNALEEEMAYTRTLVQQLLADLEDDINRDNLKRLLYYSRRMAGFQSRARYVKSAVDEVLDSDEDLSAMYLTARSQGRPRALTDHEQLELLLESFAKQVEEIVSEIDTTVANMQSTQEIAELMLDSGRNALLTLDLKVSIATLGIGTGAMIAGVFGMNLQSSLEEQPYAFLIVSGGAAALALFITLWGNRILRRVSRVALSGRSPRQQLIAARAASQRASWTMATDSLGRPVWKLTPSETDVRPSLMQWLFRRKMAAAMASQRDQPGSQVWMNRRADGARVRDAFLAEQDGRLMDKVNAKEDEDEYGWEPGPWKWGRGKAKWARD